MRFQHTVTTSASPEVIWQLWTDVADWPQWDDALEWARIQEQWALGATGTLKSIGSPATTFTISEFNPGTSYTFTTALSFAQLHVRRELVADARITQFTHIVSFTGPLAGVWNVLLGRRFRRMLPGVMERLQRIAEQPVTTTITECG